MSAGVERPRVRARRPRRRGRETSAAACETSNAFARGGDLSPDGETTFPERHVSNDVEGRRSLDSKTSTNDSRARAFRRRR